MRFLLLPLGIVYGIIITLRNFFYDVGIFKITPMSTPVISVGNITAGGAGKTPMTITLAEVGKLRGFKPGIVSRGYGRNSKGLQIVHDGNEMKDTVENSGDEPFLMASLLKDIPVVVSGNRVDGADRLIQDYGVNLIILDDAFQHRKIYRDIDIVLINASEKSSAYHMLPVGQLREFPWELNRAETQLTPILIPWNPPGLYRSFLPPRLRILRPQLLLHLPPFPHLPYLRLRPFRWLCRHRKPK